MGMQKMYEDEKNMTHERQVVTHGAGLQLKEKDFHAKPTLRSNLCVVYDELVKGLDEEGDEGRGYETIFQAIVKLDNCLEQEEAEREHYQKEIEELKKKRSELLFEEFAGTAFHLAKQVLNPYAEIGMQDVVQDMVMDLDYEFYPQDRWKLGKKKDHIAYWKKVFSEPKIDWKAKAEATEKKLEECYNKTDSQAYDEGFEAGKKKAEARLAELESGIRYAADDLRANAPEENVLSLRMWLLAWVIGLERLAGEKTK